MLNVVYFLFFGLLIFGNLKGFVTFFFRFLKFFFKSFVSKFISSEVLVLVSAEVVGLYFTCSFYLVASKLPERHSANLHHITDQLDFANISKCLDRYFLGSVLVSACLLTVQEKMKPPLESKNKLS